MIHTLLGVRTDFSLGESALPAEKLVDIAKSLKQTHIAVADTMTTSSLIDLSKAAAKEDLALHFGVRLRIVDDASERDKKQNRTAFHPKIWAKNAEGMRAIFRLLSRSTDEDRFYYVARLSLEDVLALDPRDVLLTTGDIAGVFSRPDHEAIWKRLREWSAETTIELVAVPTPYFERANVNACKAMDGTDPLIVTSPVLHEEDGFSSLFHNMAIHNRTNLRRPVSISKPAFQCFEARDVGAFLALVKQTTTGMRSFDDCPTHVGLAFKEGLTKGAEAFLDATAYRWAKEPIALPSLAPCAHDAVLEACKLGIRKRLTRSVFGHQPTPSQIREVYVPRLTYELGVLRDLNFGDYFLVVADLVNWAKGAGIVVGPGRGSVGGSLVAYLMGITDIDPIHFGLIFERFINPSRLDLPDADLDFMSSRREEVCRYLESKYGADHVAGISNYGVLGAASALKDMARVYGLDISDFAPSKVIPAPHGQPVDLVTAKRQVADIQRFADQYPDVWKGALATEGLMRSYGRHAAGVIVSGVPIVDRAVLERDGSGRKVSWDMRVCEDMGLVKLDVLGLSTLDALARCKRYIKERRGIDLDLLSVPLDDADTLKAFSMGESIGVFQFDGGSVRRLLKSMAENSNLTFEDLSAANALNRPGPIDAGLLDDFVAARTGKKTVTVAHPAMEPALKGTYGVIVYQEQVIRIAVDLCGFPLADADKLRKAMGKKLPEEMAKMRAQFVAGAHTHSGMTEKAANALFDDIDSFSGYAFNKSHSAAYSLIAYQCMYLKVHFPPEFYAGTLSASPEHKYQVIVNDALKNGITVLPPDVNVSTNEFVIADDKTLIMPFSAIKGLSDKGAKNLIQGRKKTATGAFADLDDLTANVEARLVNSRSIDSLNRVGAIASIMPGEPPQLDVSRRKDQMILLPGLMTGIIEADRQMPADKYTRARIMEIVGEYYAITDEATGTPLVHVAPGLGKKAKFMVVADGPERSEEMERIFTAGRSFAFTSAALIAADLCSHDAYWTGLTKKRKIGKVYLPSDIKTYSPFLVRELEILKPPLIVTLGSNAARFFVPDLKGDMLDHVGRTFYSEKLDATILIGFNPQMIYHDPSKADLLTHVFEVAKSVIAPLG